MISGILSNTAKQELIKSKPDPSQDINRAFVLLNHFCFSKANIVNNSGSYEDNFLIYITKISVIKWGYDEIINEEPQNLMSNPELAKRIKGLAYGTLGILNPVLPCPPFFVPFSIDNEDDSIVTSKSENELMNLLFLDESDHASRPAEKKENDTPSSIIEDSEVLLPATQKSLQDTPASLSLQTQPLNQIAPHVTNPLVQSADSLEENYPIPFTQRSELSLHSRIKKVKHRTMNALATIGFVDFSDQCEWKCRWK